MGARALIACAALLCACGPRPRARVESVEERGGRMVVVVAVDNAGGTGEASVTVRLTDRKSGAVFVKEEGVPLESGRAARAAVALDAPPGDYDAAVEAAYPP